MSHRAAAEWIEVSQQTFSRWVSGQYFPDEEHVPLVARFLGLSQAKVKQIMGPRVRSVSTTQRLARVEEELADLRQAITRLLARLD